MGDKEIKPVAEKFEETGADKERLEIWKGRKSLETPPKLSPKDQEERIRLEKEKREAWNKVGRKPNEVA